MSRRLSDPEDDGWGLALAAIAHARGEVKPLVSEALPSDTVVTGLALEPGERFQNNTSRTLRITIGNTYNTTGCLQGHFGATTPSQPLLKILGDAQGVTELLRVSRQGNVAVGSVPMQQQAMTQSEMNQREQQQHQMGMSTVEIRKRLEQGMGTILRPGRSTWS